MKYLNMFSVIDCGIYDTKVPSDKCNMSDRNLYILFDDIKNPELFLKFLEYSKENKFYLGHYFNKEYSTIPKYMVVFKFPKILELSYDKFKEGKYSKMYSHNQLNFLFSNEPDYKLNIDYQILSKTGDIAIYIFRQIIKKEFNITTEITLSEFQKMEWELPPKIEEEIFRFKNVYDTIYFKKEKKNYNEKNYT